MLTPLRYAADGRTLLLISSWFAVEAFGWTRVSPNAAAAMAMIGVASLGSFVGAVAAHNALHCPVFKHRWLENVWRCVLTLVYGHPVSAYVPAHNISHHQHLETSHDAMRTSKARSRVQLHNLLFFAPSITVALLRAELGYLRFAWNRRPRWRNQVLRELFVLAVVTASLAALDPRKLVVFVMIPHASAAWGIVTMNLLQHDGAAPRSTHNHSRNFVGPIINWLTFNNGFHTVHHLRPNLHWSLAPEAHRRLVAPHVDPRLVVPSFAGYVFRTFVWPGRRARFDGVPIDEVAPVGPDTSWYAEPKPQGTTPRPLV